MERFLHFLQGTMPTPKYLGWYHILCICITVGLCLLIYIFRHQISQGAVKLILLLTGILFILFEVYKLVVLSFHYLPNGKSYWKFPWQSFPFQFCSTPMYVMLLAGISRKGKFYEACTCYLATFSLFAGGFVLLFPGDVFCQTIGINIQTMIVHGGMFVIAFMLLVTKSIKHEMQSVLKASSIFICTLSLALIMNIVWHYCGNAESFNMFYISPYIPTTMPVLRDVYRVFPYSIFFLLYALGFVAISVAIMAGTMLLDFMAELFRLKKAFPEDKTTPKILRIIKKDLK